MGNGPYTGRPGQWDSKTAIIIQIQNRAFLKGKIIIRMFGEIGLLK
jgi:hypothetical protein